MRQRKVFDAPAPALVSVAPDPANTDDPILRLPDNPLGAKSIDMTKWLGLGIDEWVWAWLSQLRVFLQRRDVTAATVLSYSYQGLTAFFQFLTSGIAPCRPSELSEAHVRQFIAWLRAQSQLKKSSQKLTYHKVKAVIVALVARGVVPSSVTLFPRNPFPNSGTNPDGETPLSSTERARLAEALRTDIIAIHKGTFGRPESEALTVYALAIALRTGLNQTPLLELRRDCLQPHPFMPNMMRLESYKRRGSNTQFKNVRISRSDLHSTSIPMDGVALMTKVLDRTKELAKDADVSLTDRLWLFRSERHSERRITILSSSHFLHVTNAIVARHGLLANNGERLPLNASRLRKTMENRLWNLSNGDLFSVAGIMGHTPAVADTSYLVCTSDMRKDATFVGEALPEMYRTLSTDDSVRPSKAIPIRSLEITPVGSCKDSLYGDKAPKDGTHCSDFLSCFSCRSYAIVGSKEDLHRLFSFYWFLDSERRRAVSRDWIERFSMTMNMIDSFTQDKFDRQLVAGVKEAARSNPNRFWKVVIPREDEGLDGTPQRI